MKIDSGFRRDVVTLCYNTLESAGFARYKRKGVDWPLHNGFNAWVGLNEGWGSDYVEISPFVGIHVQPIEKLWKSLMNLPYRRSGATYARHMGEILPNEPAFMFFSDTDLQSESMRLAKLYATVGLSYSKSIASYDALLPLLKERVDMLGAYPDRVACCLYLMNRQKEAELFVQEFKIREADYFTGFADALLAMLERQRDYGDAGLR